MYTVNIKFDQGAAGNKMVTSCPPTDTCQASMTGRLTGGHPAVGDGPVTRQGLLSLEFNLL